MRSGLVLALDRTGCLQTARWSDIGRSKRRQSVTKTLATPSDQSPEKVPETRNDFGRREIRVPARTVVCSGESPPEDHPHVSLRIGRSDRVICPYCGTQFSYWPDRIGVISLFAPGVDP